MRHRSAQYTNKLNGNIDETVCSPYTIVLSLFLCLCLYYIRKTFFFLFLYTIIYNIQNIFFSVLLLVILFSSHPEMSKQFSTLIWDYAVFGIFLICSTVYPIWKDIVGRRGESSKANFVFAAGRVSMLPMMLSIARGTLGVRSFLGK